MKTPTILVVEDNSITRKLVRVALESENYAVLEAVDGRSARELVKSNIPDLILLDLRLPDIKGTELALSLRNEPGMEHTLFIAFTGYLPRAEEADVTNAGFHGYIVKPVEPSRLVRLVREYLAPKFEFHPVSIERHRILIADDDAAQLKLRRTMFSQAGFDVITASDGAEALELARSSRPEAILTDVLMPKMDGFRLCLAVKQDPALAAIPVVMESCHFFSEEDRRLALNIGAFDYLIRSPGAKNAIEAVTAALRAKAAQTLQSSKIGHIDENYTHRIIQQLERQAAMNSALTQQCSLQAAAAFGLAAISTAIAQSTDIESIITDGLAQCLDTAGLSSGGLALFNDDGSLRLQVQIGFRDAEKTGLEKWIQPLAKIIRQGHEILIPSSNVPDEISKPLLAATNLKALLMVPLLSRGDALGALLWSSNSQQIHSDEWRQFATTFAIQFAQAISLGHTINKLAASEERYRTLWEKATDGKCILSLDGTITEINPSMAELLGRPAHQIAGKHFQNFIARDELERVKTEFKKLVDTGKASARGIRIARPDGREACADFTASTLVLKGEQTVFATARDVTERNLEEKKRQEAEEKLKQAEEKLRQAQKMEVIGQLAGGIAHDFNNILAVIFMHCDSLLEQLQKKGGAHNDIRQIRFSAERAAAMTRQLLTFSRKQINDPKPLNLNRIIDGIQEMLQRLIGEDVNLVATLDSGLNTVNIDPHQIEQILMNLAVNARDAMPQGGTLTIDTRNTELDESAGSTHIGVKSGSYVMLTVSDTGTGMNAQTTARIFEPFFTTKPPGKGTGLGLSTVFGIVKQNEGDISVYSEPGHGTVFKIYFPRYAGEKPSPQLEKPEPEPLRGTETVLVVEDMPALRAITVKALQDSGYNVLEAKDGAQALSICAEHKARIDLVLTDVVMPNVGGPEFVRRLADTLGTNATRVLFLSGYSHGKWSEYGLLESSVHFLEKPYAKKTLLTKIRSILKDGARGKVA